MISWTGTSFSFALETDADLVLCAVNTLVSIPQSLRVSLVHLEIVSPDTGLWGLTQLINNFVSLLRKSLVLLMYAFKQDKGQSVLSGS